MINQTKKSQRHIEEVMSRDQNIIETSFTWARSITLLLWPRDNYGGRKSSTRCNWRKPKQIEKTPVN